MFISKQLYNITIGYVKILIILTKKKTKGEYNMCEENKENSCGPTNKEFGAKMHHMRGGMHHMGGHGHDEMKKGLIMKKIIKMCIRDRYS